MNSNFISRAALLGTLMASAFASVTAAAAVARDFTAEVQSEVAALRDSPTAVGRLSTLSQDSQFVFDFFNPPAGVVSGAGGHTVEASSANFPAVVGNGVAMTVGFLGPCSINTPHTHPRATEINFSANGTLRTGLLTENGARFIMNELPPGSMTVFPQGAIHFEMNDGCAPAVFVAAFNSEDPGVLQLAQRFLGLPLDIISATLGDIGVEEVEGLAHLLPDNVAFGTDECLQRCGLKRPSAQPTAQQQPRVSGNAFPDATSA
ncbi:Cupin type-1 domain-containing protein [Mycena chlorophos]|uniref:Cupin type-1 domain-containing protein n=1 Tax=Mycena chlorophos TaxID=658473 RepID=A0A8H6WJC8_MYCCL|nr:Cupin type-1 domain-containing protein [Mycena chlorophos]